MVKIYSPSGKLDARAKEALAGALACLVGVPIVITVQKYVKRRSLNQNAFMHGPFLEALGDFLNECGSDSTPSAVKEFFKKMFGVYETVHLPDGTVERVPKSTADYSTVECEEAMEKARAWAADWGCMLPFPNESLGKQATKGD